MKKKRTKRIKNSKLLGYFFIFVLLTIFVSLVVRVIFLISQSKFDNRHQFVLEVKQLKEQEMIIVFDPDVNKINVLVAKGLHFTPTVSLFHIPVDATITTQNIKESSISSLLFHVFLSCNRYHCNGLNTIDALKLFLFTHSIHQDAIKTASLAIPFSTADADNTIPALFTDDTLYHGSLSIAIINASGEAGLGNSLARLLSNIGGNVISVTATQMKSEKTTIASNFTEKNYSIKRLKTIVNPEVSEVKKPAISDIIITIGQQHGEF